MYNLKSLYNISRLMKSLEITLSCEECIFLAYRYPLLIQILRTKFKKLLCELKNYLHVIRKVKEKKSYKN